MRVEIGNNLAFVLLICLLWVMSDQWKSLF